MSQYDYERQLITYIQGVSTQLLTRPLNLGGAGGAGGGTGGPVGGFTGYLPQTRVAYDSSELETALTTASGSLLDNLNHIRYRISALEAGGGVGSGVSSITVYDDGVLVSSAITVLDFINATVSAVGNRATITVSGGGGATGSGISAIAVQDSGVPVSSSITTLNFVGADVSAAGSVATVTVSGGGSSSGGGLDPDLITVYRYLDVTTQVPATAEGFRSILDTGWNDVLIELPLCYIDFGSTPVELGSNIHIRGKSNAKADSNTMLIGYWVLNGAVTFENLTLSYYASPVAGTTRKLIDSSGVMGGVPVNIINCLLQCGNNAAGSYAYTIYGTLKTTAVNSVFQKSDSTTSNSWISYNTTGSAYSYHPLIGNHANKSVGTFSNPPTATELNNAFGPATGYAMYPEALFEVLIDNGGTHTNYYIARSDGVNWLVTNGVDGSSSGSGDVVGPASAVDGHLAVFDGTTGKLIKDGGAIPTTHDAVTVSDSATIDFTLTGQALSAVVLPGGIDAADLASGAAADGYVLTADGAGGAAWEAAAAGTGSGLESWFNVKDYGATGDGTTDDTTAIQAALDAAATGGGVAYFPAGTYIVSRLAGHKNVAMIGAGRESTTIKGNTAGVNLVTILGSAKDSYYEVDHAPTIEGITFDGNNTTPVGFGFVGVAYFDIHRCTFKRFTTTGVDFYASLQMRVDDTKFLSNATGIKYHAENIDYYGGTIPPNRVIVTWSTFYDNTYRAIDYSGGQQLIIENSEFGNNGTEGNASTAAIWFTGTGDPDGPGLILRGGWMEHNHGYAAINIAASSSILRHSIEDTFFAYTDATYGIAVDGSNGQTFVAFEQVSMDTSGTVRTYYHTGANLELDFENCTGVLSGTGGVIRQDPMLDGSPTPGGLTFSDAEGDPVTVDATAAADGTSDYAARRDHRHQLGAHTHTASEIVDLPATSGKYRVMLYEVSGGTFTFLTDATGNPLEGLVALE